MKLIPAFAACMTLLSAQTAEFIAERMPTPSCYASTIVETRDGALIAAWFGGTEEGALDVGIWLSRRENGRWTTPVETIRETRASTYNPVLFETGDGLLWLYYKFGTHPTSWTGGRKSSRDGGRTWSAVEHLPAGLFGPIRAKPLVMPDGLIVSGTSVESFRSWACWIERSADHGKTWTKHGPIVTPPRTAVPAPAAKAPPGVEGAFPWSETHGIIQPSVVPLGGKRLRLYARATATVGRIVAADSEDLGITWSAARPIDLPNPNSGIDAVRLRDGRFLMVYNHTTAGRSPLNLAVSRDGEKWRMFHALETEPGEFSYPSLIQGRDGDLHVTYTWNRKKVRHVRFPLKSVP